MLLTGFDERLQPDQHAVILALARRNISSVLVTKRNLPLTRGLLSPADDARVGLSYSLTAVTGTAFVWASVCAGMYAPVTRSVRIKHWIRFRN